MLAPTSTAFLHAHDKLSPLSESHENMSRAYFTQKLEERKEEIIFYIAYFRVIMIFGLCDVFFLMTIKHIFFQL